MWKKNKNSPINQTRRERINSLLSTLYQRWWSKDYRNFALCFIVTGIILVTTVGCAGKPLPVSESWTCTYKHPSPYKTQEVCKKN